MKDKKELIVKITPLEEETPFDKELPNERIYATRQSNFYPAYELLKKHSIKTFELFAYSLPTQDIPYLYSVTSILEGVSIREFVAEQNQPDIEKLHILAGEEFGKLHQITRSFSGWVNQKKPLKSWGQAFFESIHSKLEKDVTLESEFIKIHEQKLRKFITEKQNIWKEQREFVFSEISGFQGMARYENGRWEFSGIIDVEDHKFTDQRMVLAGYELSVDFEGKEVPKSFWQGYKKHKRVSDDYSEFKNLFMLYYLLFWLPIIYDNEKDLEKDEQLQTIEKFERSFWRVLTK